VVEDAREAVAGLVGGDPKLVTFVSGGTEANNTVLTPDWRGGLESPRLTMLVASAVEHASVLAGGRFAADAVRRIEVDRNGVVRLASLATLLDQCAQCALVSVMLANNETGVLQPVSDVSRIAHAAGAFVHCDAVQAAGRVAIDIGALGVDVLTLSAHKIGGPKGAGAVVRANEDVTVAPLLTGGGQERRLRGGTEDVAAIAGFGAAARTVAGSLAAEATRLKLLRDGLERQLKERHPGLAVFGHAVERVPNTSCFALPGVSAETLVIALDLAGIAVSSGSACSSGKVAPSHVLAAMGVAPALAKGALRVSLGWESAEKDLDSFARAWGDVLSRIAPETIAAA
jgi:cysteine desulfurase